MIVFNYEKYIDEIKKNGIGANDPMAQRKIKDVAKDFLTKTKYHKPEIVRRVKQIANAYYAGLPDELAIAELNEVLEGLSDNQSDIYEPTEKIISLYRSEMETIASLNDDRLMKFAFAALVVHKFCGQYFVNGIEKCYAGVKSCNADLYRISGLTDLSGTARDKLLNTLCEKGIMSFYAVTNRAFRFNPDWIAMSVYTVPFNVDLKEDKTTEEVFMQITNYSDILLYLRYYLGDLDIMLCADCGCPIIKTGNKKSYCDDCIDRHKQTNDRRNYLRKQTA